MAEALSMPFTFALSKALRRHVAHRTASANLCEARRISAKELRHYYTQWIEGNKTDESLLHKKQDAHPGSRRTPKEAERNIIKAYRRFGSNRYKLVLLFKPCCLDKTPSPAAMNLRELLKKSIPSKPCAVNWA
ncbi:MAG: hypothetical protein HY265_08055 [Deltaproteobacteria bacterium]|nr:hypothetical protein [Deltaproteobacteria bacterium]MBI3756095.1 hypothetical protein [Deltaproteobacteria bacterium]